MGRRHKCSCLLQTTGESEEEEARAQALSDNFNRAEFIRDRLVPRAVLFFTGEAIEEDDDDEVCVMC